MPSDFITALTPWPKGFSQGITPVQRHSHNDYWRSVPLFDALTAGATEPRPSSLSADRSLQSLYIKSLTTILTQINQGANFPVPRSGVFETLPNASRTLLIIVKSVGHTPWPVVMDQLAPLRASGWLLYWNRTGGGLAWRPITVLHCRQLILRKRIVKEGSWNRLAKQTSERDYEEDDRYGRGKGIGVTILGYTRVAGGSTDKALAILGGEWDWDTECG
ncbi:hypothetical protein EYZ11_010549 [Aspergillus tanneri]|uniref:Uncharacterized protein n=1 Tax=Aspergillus tanneri TaxID=1220188 RepID=A0A4S3J536_9EURO|nr:hypothetical protein EYZ11_010549 [Aspergillus tanneri]